MWAKRLSGKCGLDAPSRSREATPAASPARKCGVSSPTNPPVPFRGRHSELVLRQLCPEPFSFRHVQPLYVSRSSLIAALLIAALGASVSNCLATTENTDSRCGHRTHSVSQAPTATHSKLAADHCAGSPSTHCSMRGLLQFHFLPRSAFAMSTPSLRPLSHLAQPRASKLKLTSIGSPQTDRGPPLS